MNTETISAIIDTIQSNTRDAVALLRLVADEYERAHNNVQGLVESILPDYTPKKREVKTPSYAKTPVLDMVSKSPQVGMVEDKPLQDTKGNFEVVPGSAGKETPLNVAAEVRKILDRYFVEEREYLLKDLYKEVRSRVPGARQGSIYNAYSNHIKASGWETYKVTENNITHFKLAEKH